MIKWFSRRVKRTFNDEKIVFSTDGAGKTEYPHIENEAGPLPHTICKN